LKQLAFILRAIKEILIQSGGPDPQDLGLRICAESRSDIRLLESGDAGQGCRVGDMGMIFGERRQ